MLLILATCAPLLMQLCHNFSRLKLFGELKAPFFSLSATPLSASLPACMPVCTMMLHGAVLCCLVLHDIRAMLHGVALCCLILYGVA